MTKPLDKETVGIITRLLIEERRVALERAGKFNRRGALTEGQHQMHIAEGLEIAQRKIVAEDFLRRL